MAKHAKKCACGQLVDAAQAPIAMIPLPLLGAIASFERPFLGLCAVVGQQVPGSVMDPE